MKYLAFQWSIFLNAFFLECNVIWELNACINFKIQFQQRCCWAQSSSHPTNDLNIQIFFHRMVLITHVVYIWLFQYSPCCFILINATNNDMKQSDSHDSAGSTTRLGVRGCPSVTDRVRVYDYIKLQMCKYKYDLYFIFRQGSTVSRY